MNKKVKVILVLLIFFFSFAGFLAWYFDIKINLFNSDNNKKVERGGGLNDDDIYFFGDRNLTDNEDENKEYGPKKIKKYGQGSKRVKMPRLRQISDFPTAGIYFDDLNIEELHTLNVKEDMFDTDDALKYKDAVSEIRYVAQKNGNIYSTYTYTNKTKRISNTTILKIFDAEFWDKNNLIMRYLDPNNNKNIRTYSVELREKTEQEIEEEKKKARENKIEFDENILAYGGIFLPSNIFEYSLLPESKKIFFLVKDNKGKISGIVSGSKGEDKVKVYETELTELNVNWKNKKYVLINNKAAKDTGTLFFKVDTIKGGDEKVANLKIAGNGLPSYDFNKILISGKNNPDDLIKLSVYDLRNGNVIRVDLSTVAEKCVWSKNNIDIYCAVPEFPLGKDEPDMWYKGYSLSNDLIYKIDSRTGSFELVFGERKGFDIIKPKLDYFEKYFYFIDWNTGFAWSYQLKDEEKGEVKKLENNRPEEEKKNEKEFPVKKKCDDNLILTQYMKVGDRDGRYSNIAGQVINEVKVLQKMMEELGYRTGPIDGIFGRQTRGAVINMQKDLGVKATGEIDEATRKAVNASCGN